MRRRSRGTVLVLGAMLFFALLALAALTIDLGVARLEQDRMQTAVDAAALEAVAGRDPQAAIDVAFDDPWTAGVAPPAANAIAVTDAGVGPAFGSQTIQASGLYAPVLAPNGMNEAHGDVVRGAFAFDPVTIPNLLEPADYDRRATDFDHTAPANAVLVRLRRTRSPVTGLAPALDDVPGVSTTGPALPLLFGHASTIHAGGAYDPRRDGFQVRATAIASTRSAMAVGLPQPSTPGVAPFVIEASAFATMDAQVLANGEIHSGGNLAGRYYGSPLAAVASVGDAAPAPPPAALPFAASAPVEAYVPVIATIAGTSRVIGFGRATFEHLAGGPPDLRIVRLPGGIATNASALVYDGLVADVDAVLAAHAAFSHSILAPVLVR